MNSERNKSINLSQKDKTNLVLAIVNESIEKKLRKKTEREKIV